MQTKNDFVFKVNVNELNNVERMRRKEKKECETQSVTNKIDCYLQVDLFENNSNVAVDKLRAPSSIDQQFNRMGK